MEYITLGYQPIPFLKITRKIKGEFPSTFGELKPSQLIAITGLINERISETTFLNIMTGIPKFRIKQLDSYATYKLLTLFEPFTEVKPFHSFIIPKIKTSKSILFSPKSKLAGITFGQFIFIDSYFASYQAKRNDTDLQKFVASLYLPEHSDFDESRINYQDLNAKKVKHEILDAIVINYVLIKEWLALAYPLIFQSIEEDETNPTPKKHNDNTNHSAWLKIFDNVVGDDLVNHDRYATLPLHNVFRWMTQKIKETMKRK
jgi:hypothetical protein